MSTGADCTFIEVAPGRWTYRLQRWPYGDSDDYDTYGHPPFRSFRAAHDHLGDNHANPGGYSVRVHAQHVHEWEVDRGAYVPAGVEVTLRIESLGPEPTPEAIIAHLASYPFTPAHLSIRAATRWDETVRTKACEACGATA